jgi:hypothetical protein
MPHSCYYYFQMAKARARPRASQKHKADFTAKTKMMLRLRLDIHTEDHDKSCKRLECRDDQVIILHSVVYSPKMIYLSDSLFAHLTYCFPADVIAIIFKYSFEITDFDTFLIEGQRGCHHKTISGWCPAIQLHGHCSANSYSTIRSLTIEEEKFKADDDDQDVIELPFSLGFIKPIKVIQHIERSMMGGV